MTDLAWIDTAVSPNGFEGWLDMTPVAQIASALAALDLVGADDVKALVTQALAIVGLDPATMSDPQREALVDSLSPSTRKALDQLGSALFDLMDAYMERIRTFIEANPDHIHP
ncbi:hypothetical protein Cs7R123_07030 [Catellatospora sp. TT07R-123]|nr:hypothetical protein Cs7R123_07030 [Catellatospora sp. TT07R-123]